MKKLTEALKYRSITTEELSTLEETVIANKSPLDKWKGQEREWISACLRKVPVKKRPKNPYEPEEDKGVQSIHELNMHLTLYLFQPPLRSRSLLHLKAPRREQPLQYQGRDLAHF